VPLAKHLLAGTEHLTPVVIITVVLAITGGAATFILHITVLTKDLADRSTLIAGARVTAIVV